MMIIGVDYHPSFQTMAFLVEETGECMRRLLLENRFPRIWVPDPENRDLRQLLWHRHRLVQMRTRIMNQLQALAMNEGYRWKKKLFSEQGRAQLEKLALAPWASRRRQELLELLAVVVDAEVNKEPGRPLFGVSGVVRSKKL